MNLNNVVDGQGTYMRKQDKLRIGDVVRVYNHTPSGKRFFEGEARLQRRWAGTRDSETFTEEDMKLNLNPHEFWQVRFLSDGSVADRWIEQ